MEDVDMLGKGALLPIKSSTAIILAAGVGKRMGVNVPKQYIMINGKPILYYTLLAFENSEVDRVVLVVGKGEVTYVKDSIIEKYNLNKVVYIVEGGDERYLSVYEGLKVIDKSDYIMVHDGARPMVTCELINRSLNDTIIHGSSIVAVPSKDTVRIISDEMLIEETPQRSKVWNIQTPQTFQSELLIKSYTSLISRLNEGEEISKRDSNIRMSNEMFKNITDDAMVVELYCQERLHITYGDYKNIKVTTIEDVKYLDF